MRRVWHVARHRRAGGRTVVDTSRFDLDYEPRHCGGALCTHNHTGGSRPLVGTMRTFAPLTQPKPVVDPRTVGRDARLPLPTWKRRTA